MYRRIIAFTVLLAVSVVRAETINVAAAISLKEAVTEIGKAYEADTANHVDFTFGSSGQLMAQIQSGAPIDTFVSAANKQVDDLGEFGLTDDSTRCVVAGNELVLIVPAAATNPPSGFAALADASVKKIAIGEPKTVPAGQYSEQVLKKLGVDQKLGDRLIYGANVRQVLDYVERGEVSAGIVYRTDARECGDKVKVIATADNSLHEPIVYPAVVIKSSQHAAAAKKFLGYLKTEKARTVLVRFGFTAADGSTKPGGAPSP